MANWWDAAPLVEQPSANWWDAAPLVSPATTPPQAPAPAVSGDMASVMGGDWEAGARAANEGSGRNSPLGRIDTAMRGAADMMTFGFADEIAAGADALLNPVLGTGQAGGSLGERYAANVKQQRAIDAQDAQERGGTRLAGQIGGGLTSALGLARSGFLPSVNAAASGARLRTVAGLSGLEGAAMGALQGAGSGEGLDGSLTAARDGAVVGGGLGVAVPLAVAGATSAVRRIVSPQTIAPERQAAARVLQSEGIETTAGQQSGSIPLRFRESELGGARAAALMERQGEQFTAAALRRAGETAPRATADVLDSAFTRIGQQFDDLAARNTMRPDQQFVQDLVGAVREYGAMVPPSQRAPIIEGIGGDIIDAIRGGQPIQGDTYQKIASRLAKAARGTSDTDLRAALYGMRDALDGAMERSIAAVNPTDAGLWREARNQYRNLLTIERAATGAGENAALGLISPSALRNATVNTQGRRSYARGSGDFAELARAGEALLKPLPNSGTAPRLRAQNLGAAGPMIAGAIGGGAYGAYSGDPYAGLAGMAAGAALPRVAGALLMSRPGQAYLSNQALAGPMDPARRAILNSLLAVPATGVYPRR